MKSIVDCLLFLVVSVQCQWMNNFGSYAPAGYFGGYYPANGFHMGYTGPFYGQPGRFINYPSASLPSYDAFGNQVGGYGPVQDTPEVAQAKAAHFAAHDAARARLIAPVAAVPVVATPVVDIVAAPSESVAVETPISRKKRQIQPLTPVGSHFPLNYGGYYPAINVPHTAYMAGIVPMFPVSTSTQYHAQDEFGQATFGYAYPGQAATNYRDALGNQIGSYSYFNAEGKQVQVSYTADHRGFRVLSNDLPVAPVQVQDSPEVAQAKAAHFAAHATVKARLINTSPASADTISEPAVVSNTDAAIAV